MIRKLELSDAPRCAELERILFPGDNPWSEQAFVQEFSQPNNHYVGEELDGILVGYAGLALLGSREDPEFEIHTIGVDPAYQGRGIGSQLMDQLVHVADLMHGPIYLEVRTDNTAAIKLYEKFGFVTLGTRKNYYQPSGADAFTMKREA